MADARLFVSHSHHDNAFGLRLIADLRARLGNEAVWFDASGGLQGGDEWWRTIVNEILARDYFLVILSPEALASPWVRKEMDLAYNQHVSRGKRLLPLLYHQCEPSADWQLIQTIAIGDPQQDTAVYERGLQNVLNLIDPGLGYAPARPTYTDEELYNLYKQGLQARNTQQWEACADSWRKVLAADPKYLGGSLATDMVEVERNVAALNVERLRQSVRQAKASGDVGESMQALYALTLADPGDETAKKDLWASGVAKADAEHRDGAWDDEIATWNLLLNVLPSDTYASRRKANVEQNKQYVQMYRLARELTREGKKTEAKEQLTKLWQHAPYYGDPSGIAPSLGLAVLPTYDEVLEEQRKAEAARKKAEDEALAARRKIEAKILEYRREASTVDRKIAELGYDSLSFKERNARLGIFVSLCVLTLDIVLTTSGHFNLAVAISALIALLCLLLGFGLLEILIAHQRQQKLKYDALNEERMKLQQEIERLQQIR
jgi:hypothetical protein